MRWRIIYFLIIVFFSLHTVIPRLSYDPSAHYKLYKSYYYWLHPAEYHLIYYYANKYKVSLDDICAIIQSESNGTTTAVSCADARGLMQIMPFHYKGPKKDLFDPSLNLSIGVRYWAKCLIFAHGNRARAIMAYNAGPASPISNYKNWDYLNAIIKNSRNTKKIFSNYQVVIK